MMCSQEAMGTVRVMAVACAVANKPLELAVEPRFTIRDDYKTETCEHGNLWYAPTSRVQRCEEHRVLV